MIKKRLFFSLAFLLLLFFLFAVFFYPPQAFLTNNETIEKLKSSSNLVPDTITAKIFVDDKHVFVPFSHSNGQAGGSYWEWKWFSWKLLSTDSKGQMKLWKIDKDHEYFVWNLNEKDKVKTVKLFLIKERNYIVSGGISKYEPAIQLEKKISLVKDYGALKMPKSWREITNSGKNISWKKNLFVDTPSYPYLLLGWTSLGEKGEWIFPVNSVNGNEFREGDVELENLPLLDKNNLQ